MTTARAAIIQATAPSRGEDPTLTGTRARTRHCRTCGHLVIAGYDNHVMAALAITDPYRATWQDEAAAVILARPTYRLLGPWPTHAELVPRHQPDIPPTAHHPPAEQVIVLIAHRCGTPPLATTPLATTAPRSGGYPDQPPF
jgi:hypothetical protein